MQIPGESLIIKLWDTLADKGIGALLRPWQIRRDGRAHNEVRSEQLRMLAQAEQDCADIRAGRAKLTPDGRLLQLPAPSPESAAEPSGRIAPHLTLPAISEAADITRTSEAARSEINAAKAVIFAEEILENDPQRPSERPIDDDWLFMWRDYAGKVSSEELQRLWGSVLAGEVKSPGKHSLRTLDFLRALSKDEADLIVRLAPFVIDGIVVRSSRAILDAHGLPFQVLLSLQELGVLSGVEAIGFNVQHKSAKPDKFFKALISHNRVLVVEQAAPALSFQLEAFAVSAVGRQVLSLGSFQSNEEYLLAIGRGIVKQGFDVRLGDWVQTDENSGRYSNARPVTADA